MLLLLLFLKIIFIIYIISSVIEILEQTNFKLCMVEIEVIYLFCRHIYSSLMKWYKQNKPFQTPKRTADPDV